MIAVELTILSGLFHQFRPMRALNLLILDSVNLSILLIDLATPIALLCGIVLKFRQSLRHLGNPEATRENLKVLMIFAIAGIIITFPIGWNISRLAMR